jgi:uncharacterized protein with HEPN domain
MDDAQGSIFGFRNIAIHACFSVDWRLVWNAAVSDASALMRDFEAILESR